MLPLLPASNPVLWCALVLLTAALVGLFLTHTPAAGVSLDVHWCVPETASYPLNPCLPPAAGETGGDVFILMRGELHMVDMDKETFLAKIPEGGVFGEGTVLRHLEVHTACCGPPPAAYVMSSSLLSAVVQQCPKPACRS